MNTSITRSLSVTAVTGALVLGGAAAASADSDSRSEGSERSSELSLGAPIAIGESTFDSFGEEAERIQSSAERSIEHDRDGSTESRSISSDRQSESSRDARASLGSLSIDPALSFLTESAEQGEREARDHHGEDSSSKSERSESRSGLDARSPVEVEGPSFDSQKESAERESSEQLSSRSHGEDGGDARSDAAQERESADRSESSGKIGGLEADPNLSTENGSGTQSEKQEHDNGGSERDADGVGGLVDGLLGGR